MHRKLYRMSKYPYICVQVLAIVFVALQTEKCIAQEVISTILPKALIEPIIL